MLLGRAAARVYVIFTRAAEIIFLWTEIDESETLSSIILCECLIIDAAVLLCIRTASSFGVILTYLEIDTGIYIQLIR